MPGVTLQTSTGEEVHAYDGKQSTFRLPDGPNFTRWATTRLNTFSARSRQSRKLRRRGIGSSSDRGPSSWSRTAQERSIWLRHCDKPAARHWSRTRGCIGCIAMRQRRANPCSCFARCASRARRSSQRQRRPQACLEQLPSRQAAPRQRSRLLDARREAPRYRTKPQAQGLGTRTRAPGLRTKPRVVPRTALWRVAPCSCSRRPRASAGSRG